MDNVLGYLVKIVNNCGKQRILHIGNELHISIINKIGIITYVYRSSNYNLYNVTIKNKYMDTVLVYKDEIEILNNEPIFNLFDLRCFWCGEINKKIMFKRQNIYYCPKCLR